MLIEVQINYITYLYKIRLELNVKLLLLDCLFFLLRKFLLKKLIITSLIYYAIHFRVLDCGFEQFVLAILIFLIGINLGEGGS